MRSSDLTTQVQGVLIYEDIMIHGKSWAEVAESMGISVQEAMAIHDEQKAQMDLVFKTSSDANKVIVNRALMDVIAMAREGLEKSRLPKVRRTVRTTRDGDDESTSEEVVEEPHEAGDPRWLSNLLTAIKQFSDLNVRALPKEVEIDIRSQHEIRLVDMTDEELARKAALFDAINAGVLEVDPVDVARIEDESDAGE